MRGLGDLRQRHDVGPAAHDRGEIIHAVELERIDADRGHGSRLAPGAVELGRERASQRPQRGRRKILQLLDQDIGA